jgi:hypothetical protein
VAVRSNSGGAAGGVGGGRRLGRTSTICSKPICCVVSMRLLVAVEVPSGAVGAVPGACPRSSRASTICSSWICCVASSRKPEVLSTLGAGIPTMVRFGSRPELGPLGTGGGMLGWRAVVGSAGAVAAGAGAAAGGMMAGTPSNVALGERGGGPAAGRGAATGAATAGAVTGGRAALGAPAGPSATRRAGGT